MTRTMRNNNASQELGEAQEWEISTLCNIVYYWIQLRKNNNNIYYQGDVVIMRVRRLCSEGAFDTSLRLGVEAETVSRSVALGLQTKDEGQFSPFSHRFKFPILRRANFFLVSASSSTPAGDSCISLSISLYFYPCKY